MLVSTSCSVSSPELSCFLFLLKCPKCLGDLVPGAIGHHGRKLLKIFLGILGWPRKRSDSERGVRPMETILVHSGFVETVDPKQTAYNIFSIYSILFVVFKISLTCSIVF